MVRAPWNRETQGGLAIINGPTADPAARKSFALLEPLAPGSGTARQYTPTAASVAPASARQPPIEPPAALIRQVTMRIERGSCSDLNSKAREWPHQTDRIAAAGYDSAGLPGPAETAVGDAASRVHAVAPVTIAPITAKTSRTRSDEVVSPERP